MLSHLEKEKEKKKAYHNLRVDIIIRSRNVEIRKL